LTGEETFTITGISDGLTPRETLDVTATRDDGSEVKFKVVARVDSPVEIEYYRNGGILQTVLRRLVNNGASPNA
jgi:aconitate hydratase